ncbi:hypothetical protein Y032_0510g2735 [Ancylostoma ceylanicum]|uniref:C-type lectin domain-containing protein n=2 Tax=Ancylostoma ceylanicum TaxID=53326 RepID=A0A016WV87_9BILA|nr:hypothetical protein Y032_0510g2735 [Ancylostoma ceylanicum]
MCHLLRRKAANDQSFSHSAPTMLCICLLFLAVGAVSAYDIPTPSHHFLDLQSNRINGNNTVTAATCRDNDLARFMNNAMSAYIHDMGGLSRNILDQITAYRKPGTWLVHAEIISGRAQGREWQTLTNGDVFSGRSLYGCYYHDMQTYVLVLRLY